MLSRARTVAFCTTTRNHLAHRQLQTQHGFHFRAQGPQPSLRAIKYSARRQFAASSSPGQNNSSTAKSFLLWYSQILQERPILTKAVTSGLIAGAGDWLCQYILHIREQQQQEHQQPPRKGTLQSGWQQTPVTTTTESPTWWDQKRTARFVFLGAVFVAPVIHWWYNVLARQWPSTALSSVLRRVAVDQLLFTPVYLPVWLTALWTLEGQAWESSSEVHGVNGSESSPKPKLLDRLVQVTPQLIVANWGYWIPVQCVNFKVMPIQYQVLFSNVAALLWTAFLSFSANATGAEKRDVAEVKELPLV